MTLVPGTVITAVWRVPVVPRNLIGTIESCGTIPPALQGAVALFHRHYSEQWHYYTGTISSGGTITSALYRAVALLHRHYRERWHYSTGTIESSGTIPPALQREVALFHRHYRAVALFHRHYRKQWHSLFEGILYIYIFSFLPCIILALLSRSLPVETRIRGH